LQPPQGPRRYVATRFEVKRNTQEQYKRINNDTLNYVAQLLTGIVDLWRIAMSWVTTYRQDVWHAEFEKIFYRLSPPKSPDPMGETEITIGGDPSGIWKDLRGMIR